MGKHFQKHDANIMKNEKNRNISQTVRIYIIKRMLVILKTPEGSILLHLMALK